MVSISPFPACRGASALGYAGARSDILRALLRTHGDSIPQGPAIGDAGSSLQPGAGEAAY